MLRKTVSSLLLLAAFIVSAKAQANPWLQVRTPHFVVVSNAGEKEARRITLQLERMQSVFLRVFPESGLETAPSILVLAVQDKSTLQSLEPEQYLAKGQLSIAGLFLHAPEKNYVLLLMNATGVHPYAAVYHEYVHFVQSRTGDWMPLWLTEGLAQYYQTAEILDDEVRLGKLDPYVLNILQRNSFLPLPALLAVDHHSPYYHEEDKGSAFYAKSWLLTHYLKTKDDREGTHRVADYLDLIHTGVDSVTAGTQAFGDLAQLESDLHKYIVNSDYGLAHVPGSTDVDELSFEVQPLTQIQSDNLRAEFLAHVDRSKDAQTLLDGILREDPDNVPAEETLAYIAIRHGDLETAVKWAQSAIKLQPDSYFAHYLFGLCNLKKAPADAASKAKIVETFRTVIKLNPSFAPANELLGIALAQQSKYAEAERWIRKAIEMDPGTVMFRVDDANLLLRMDREKEAIDTLDVALRMSHTPEETAAVENILKSAKQFRVENAKLQQENAARQQKVQASGSPIIPAHPISTVQPGYTEEAARAKREGVCVLTLIVGTDGKPSNIVVTKKLGYGLDERAVEAVSRWRFEPARAYGKPIAAKFTINMPFKIYGDGDKFIELSQKARSGDHAAEFELSKAFFEGREIPKDETQGLALLQRAAQGGLPQAQFQMGERAYGDGTDADAYVEAYVWYALAQRGGLEESNAKVIELESRMTPDQATQAQKKVEIMLSKKTPN